MERHVSQRSLFHRESGSSFVETVIVLPFLLYLSLAVVEISRALNQYSLLVAIAEEGARVASRIGGAGNGNLVSSYDLATNTTATVSYYSSGSGAPKKHTIFRDRIAQQSAKLDPNDEEEALAWIESVSIFHQGESDDGLLLHARMLRRSSALSNEVAGAASLSA